MAAAGKGLAVIGFFAGLRGTFQGTDVILQAPRQRRAGIFLAVGLVHLLQVVSLALEDEARLLGVDIDDDFGIRFASVGEASPRAHKMRRRRRRRG